MKISTKTYLEARSRYFQWDGPQSKGVRLGPFFMSTFATELQRMGKFSWPELFYEENEDKAERMIKEVLTDEPEYRRYLVDG